MTATQILVADDQFSVRSAIRLILEQNGIQIAGEVSNTNELMTWLMTNKADILLLDWGISGQSCIKIIPLLHAEYPELGVIVLDTGLQPKSEVVSSGVNGFVSKGDPPERLLEAIHKYNVNSRREYIQ